MSDVDELINDLMVARDELAAAEEAVVLARDVRDALVRDAIRSGVTAYRVAKVLGVTQPAVYKIRDA